MVTEFIFLGLSYSQELQIFLFVFFFVFYVGIVFGNLLIVITVASDSHLHSPMYFLLANLSLIDLCLSSVTAPKMIADFFSKCKVISFKGCLSQIFLLHFVYNQLKSYNEFFLYPFHYQSLLNFFET